MAKVYAVIPAAGTGSRMGTKTQKQYLQLNELPVLARTLSVFEQSPIITGIILVVGEKEISWCEKEIIERFGFKKVLTVVPGGDTRQHSVYNGLKVLCAQADDVVMVHDAARPLITEDILANAAVVAQEKQSAVVAVPVKDTIKLADEQGVVLDTPPREKLWSIQTPQVFNYRLLMEAYRQANKSGYVGTDDASLVEQMGHAVHIVPGSYENIKITTAEDMLLAEAILKRRKTYCG